MRLIDADKASLYLNAEACKQIKQMPTIDAVSVIRCRECKHFDAERYEEHTPYGFTNECWACWCNRFSDYDAGDLYEVNTDDYCAWAERREDD